MRLPRSVVSLKSCTWKTRPTNCCAGSVYCTCAKPLRLNAMLACRRIAMSGVMRKKSGFGLVIAGTSLGIGSTSIVRVPPLGDGDGDASSLSSLSSSELGVGEGVGDAVGVAFGEPLGDGLGEGILKATLHVYCCA